jgi:hypothetical protein
MNKATETNIVLFDDFNKNSYISTHFTPTSVRITWQDWANHNADLVVWPVTINTLADRRALDLGRRIMKWISEGKVD